MIDRLREEGWAYLLPNNETEAIARGLLPAASSINQQARSLAAQPNFQQRFNGGRLLRFSAVADYGAYVVTTRLFELETDGPQSLMRASAELCTADVPIDLPPDDEFTRPVEDLRRSVVGLGRRTLGAFAVVAPRPLAEQRVPERESFHPDDFDVARFQVLHYPPNTTLVTPKDAPPNTPFGVAHGHRDHAVGAVAASLQVSTGTREWLLGADENNLTSVEQCQGGIVVLDSRERADRSDAPNTFHAVRNSSSVEVSALVVRTMGYTRDELAQRLIGY